MRQKKTNFCSIANIEPRGGMKISFATSIYEVLQNNCIGMVYSSSLRREGLWTFFDSTGKIESMGHHYWDCLVGTWYYFDEEGNQKSSENYFSDSFLIVWFE